MEGGVELSLGGWCVSGAGEQDGLSAFPQLLDTMLPDVCSKHVPASVVKVYMSCVVSCPLHRHLFWTALTNCSSTGIYSQNVTSSSGPTRVPVRDLMQPGFLCMANHSNLFCMGGHGSQVSCVGCRSCGTRVCLPAWW